MTRTTRTVLMLVSGAAVAVMIILAVERMPSFGRSDHPYRDHAVAVSASRHAANVVSSVNFDQRGFDTLIEETILFGSVLGVALLLRPAEDETESRRMSKARVLDSTRLAGYAMLPVTLLLGIDVVSHGQLTPGGGFQGGVVLGTGMHLLYVAGRYDTLEKLRPLMAFEWGEALGAAAFACLGIAGLIASGAFLINFVPTGAIGQLFSSGTVPLLNIAVGVEVASGVMVLLAKFLEQDIVIKDQKS